MDPIERETEKTAMRPQGSGEKSSPPEQAIADSIRSDSAKDLQPGQIIADHYKILSLIGRGGVGSVYKVEQIFLKKQLALKTVDPVVTTDVTRRRFQREAQAASKLRHANLVQAIDFGLIDETRPFLVMEFCQGKTLAEHLTQYGALSVETALQFFIPLCFAMAYAHQEGVIHRDIKPSNIVLVATEDRDQQPQATPGITVVPKIVDFGIARIEEEEALTLTKTGEIFGTPLYMSPEQCLGSNVDHRSDIYSLGCVLYESLTGAPPFRGNSALETMLQHQTGLVLPLKEASLGSEFPPALEKIVARMLAKAPNDRHQSFLEVAQDLVWLQQGQHSRVRVKEVAAPAKSARAERYDWRGLALSATVGALATAVVAVLLSKASIAPSNLAALKVPDTTNSLLVQTVNKVDKSFQEGPLPKDPLAQLLPGFFSKKEANGRTFSFPEGYTLGSIVAWNQGHTCHTQDAKQTVHMKKGERLVLVAGEETLTKPYLVTLFRSDDLAGFVIGNTFSPVEGELADRMVYSLGALTSLRAVMIRYVYLSQESLDQIDRLPNLHWLTLANCNLSGERIARLMCLPRLNVLSLGGETDYTPVLERLVREDRTIKRLSLNSCHLKPSDIELISRLPELTDLDLWSVHINSYNQPGMGKQMFASIAKLSKLKRVSLNNELLGLTTEQFSDIAPSLKKLRRLEQFWYDYPAIQADEKAALRQCLPSKCTMEQVAAPPQISARFDPSMQDPDAP